MKPGPTQARLRELVSYDPQTGQFKWKAGRGGSSGECGCLIKSGYIIIGFDHELYRAHRLAWLYVYGEWPTYIDHVNGIKNDNRIANLREATKSQNGANSKTKNPHGMKGVTFSGRMNKWTAHISINGRKKHLGTFKTKEEAHHAYLEAAKQAFGQFVRTA